MRQTTNSGTKKCGDCPATDEKSRAILLLLAMIAALIMVPAGASSQDPATPVEAGRADPFGPPVEWTGRVVAAMRNGDDTCFELVRLLGSYDRPDAPFIACSFGYYDLARYGPGHTLAVAGNLSSTPRYRIGAQVYTLPLVTAARFTRLPEVPPPGYLHYDPFFARYDPFFAPFRYPWPYCWPPCR